MNNTNVMLRTIHTGAWIMLATLGMTSEACAALTDLANAPLASSSNTAVRPNVLFTLDDSGSMAWSYLPDYAGGTVISGATANHCKVSHTCSEGETPYMSNEYNGVEYNPRVAYLLPVNADGTLKASQVSPWTTVQRDGYGIQSTGTINLTNGYPEKTYSSSSTCTGTACKRNGVDTNNPFSYRASVSADNPPLYAFPGNLTTSAGIQSTLYNGLLNQGTPTPASTLYNGTLNVSGSTTITLNSPSVSNSGNTVTVSYSSQSPATPALAVGDTLTVVNGNTTCSSSYKDVASNILTAGANTFTYTGNANGTNRWSRTDCVITVSHAATTTAPMISSNNTTVTVTLASAHGLSTGNTVTVANGAGTCDAGYITTASVTVINATTFTYPSPANVGTASNTSCLITRPATVTQPPSPGISLAGNVVTVKLTGHGLSTGNLVQVSNGSGGTCDSGYQTSGSISVTVIDSNTFTYSPPIGSATTNSNCTINKMVAGTAASYTNVITTNGTPYYFFIIPTEYCDSNYLTKCTASPVPVTIAGVSYTYPAAVRYCKDDATASLAPGDAGAQTSVSGTLNCQAKYSVGTAMNFQSARYGLFYRIDVAATTPTYGNVVLNGTLNANGVNLVFNNLTVLDRSSRSDCVAAPNCTYAEEMTNFANWYAYYRTRMQMMKSSAGRAFLPVDNRYRAGFITINWSSGSTNLFLPINVFDTIQKTNWYAKLYAINPGNSTPLREALARAGRYFAGKTDSLNTGMITNTSTNAFGQTYHNDDPVEYSCQQNFTLMTTDGYWNGTDSNVVELDGTTMMRNYDNVNSGLSARSLGAYDGAISGASNTLADVAMYYYGTDLRTSPSLGALGTDVSLDNVPTTSSDPVAWQHLTTFTLGLADGLMTYQSNYATATTGDFSKIKSGTTGCTFSGAGTCNWPLPVHDSQTALDDLWHAAVNGRGAYYNARDPTTLSRGLSGALANINVQLASAAASSTSSPNITQTDNSIYSSTYRTVKWDGEVIAQSIDPATGNVLTSYPAASGGTQIYLWSAQTQLDTKITADVTASITSRNIYTFDPANTYNGGGSNRLRQFLYSNLNTTEQAYFDNQCTFTILSQCTAANLTAAQITSGNSGSNLINYLRGQKSYESTTPAAVFRPRDHALGDTVNAKPTYVKAPQFNFTDAVSPTYATFKTNNTSRQGALYIAANDGMLHAFNSNTGNEMWAYVPKIVLPSLYRLADTSYPNNHRFFVDGSPETMDIFVNSASSTASGLAVGWHTILVAGLNSGGRGVYALDVTDPANPIALWEICSDSTLCPTVSGIAHSDADMGYVYGNPVITKRMPDGKWVVLLTSGYNNVSTGTGMGYLYVLDAATGQVLSKTTTNSGAAASPSGLAKISAWADDGNKDNTTRFAYGGDLNGDIWRFDLGAVNSVVTPSATKIASLKDSASNAQPVTTRPELADILANVHSNTATGNPVLYIGTGRYLGTTDLSNLNTQSFYAFKDNLALTGAAANLGNPRTLTGATGMKQQSITQNTATSRLITGTTVDWATQQGWFVDFNPGGSSPGERVNLDPTLALGTLLVVTNVPDATACTVGGYSWLYQLDFKTGQNVTGALNQVAASKTGNNAITVGFVVVRLPNGQLKAIVTDATGGKTPTGVSVSGTSATRRVSWRELIR